MKRDIKINKIINHKRETSDDEVYLFILKFLFGTTTMCPVWKRLPKIIRKLFLKNDFENLKLSMMTMHFSYEFSYYFAVILKSAFNRGYVAWNCPYDHFVWIDTNDRTAWDIFGVCERDYQINIPIVYIPTEILTNYKRLNNKNYTVDDWLDIVDNYCSSNYIHYDKGLISRMILDNIINRERSKHDK